MVFSSLKFILIFMPVFFTLYYITPKNYKNLTLLIGSLSFYFIGSLKNPEHFILLLLSIMIDFYFGILIEKRKNKNPVLIVGIAFHIGALIFFKYANFIFTEITNNSLNIILPCGISFYTFQGISYIVDVKRGKIKAERSLLDFAVYISMFEQLIAGPIVTFSKIKDKLHSRIIKASEISSGLEIFIIGLGFKVLLANPLGKLFTETKNIGFESISTFLAWMGITAFTLQIYFDFLGYSKMAIGLGKMLGFDIPENFDFPYLSRSMTEFWRRWHITLGSWFREYLYIPLGGNKRGKINEIKNLFIVWLLTGMWHGAGYNFLLWGFVLFIITATEKFLIGGFLERHKVISHLYMLLLIPLTWAVFAIDDIQSLGIFFQRLFPLFGNRPPVIFKGDFIKYLKIYWPFLLIGIPFATKLPFNILKSIKNKYIRVIILLLILSGSIYCMYRGFDDPFLYFRF